MNVIETIEYKGHVISVSPDDNPSDPRENDNLGTMICFHRRYNLGDKHKFSDSQEFLEWLKENKNDIAICLPIFMYEHSEVSLSTSNKKYPFNDRWDAGQVGIVYVTKETLKKEYPIDQPQEKTIEIATNVLVAEVEEYSRYLNGDIYGYQISATEGSPKLCTDSCWGFDDMNYMIDEAKAAIDYAIEDELKEKKETCLIMAI